MLLKVKEKSSYIRVIFSQICCEFFYCRFMISLNLYIGARLIALLDSEKTEYAVNLLCKMDSTYSGVDIKVRTCQIDLNITTFMLQ